MLVVHDAVIAFPETSTIAIHGQAGQSRSPQLLWGNRLPETVRPLGSDDPLGCVETRALANARYYRGVCRGQELPPAFGPGQQTRSASHTRLRVCGYGGGNGWNRRIHGGHVFLLLRSRRGHAIRMHLTQTQTAAEAAPAAPPRGLPHAKKLGIPSPGRKCEALHSGSEPRNGHNHHARKSSGHADPGVSRQGHPPGYQPHADPQTRVNMRKAALTMTDQLPPPNTSLVRDKCPSTTGATNLPPVYIFGRLGVEGGSSSLISRLQVWGGKGWSVPSGRAIYKERPIDQRNHKLTTFAVEKFIDERNHKLATFAVENFGRLRVKGRSFI